MEAAVAIERELVPECVEVEDFANMPEEYQQQVIRIMSMQAYAERLGAVELGKWIEKAPDYQEMRVLARICSDEANHAYWLYRELDAIGVSMAESIAIAEGKSGRRPEQSSLKGPKEVGAEQNDFYDVAMNNMFLDRAGRFMVQNFARSSFGPWARVCQRIVHDEHLHQGFGLSQLKKMLASDLDRSEMRLKVTRWYALGLNFFGPPRSSKTELLKKFGIKRKSNQDLRLEYIKEVGAIMEELGASDLLALTADEFPYQ